MASRLNHRCGDCWRRMATIEVERTCGALDDVLEDISFDSRLEPAPAASADVLRFDLVVNASRGDDRAAMTAFALLSALEAIAENGSLPGFRIVAGDEWLHPGIAHGAWARRARVAAIDPSG